MTPPAAATTPARGARIGRRLLAGLLLFALVSGGLAVWGDVRKLPATLGHYAVWTFVAALALAALNYAVRFVRWQYYLGLLDLRVPRTESWAIFLSGFALAVTPGKLGDVLKSFLLRARRGVPVARSVTIVAAERLTDLLSVTLLALWGAWEFGRFRALVVLAAALTVGIVVLVSWRRACLGLLALGERWGPIARIAHKLRESYDSLQMLVRPRALVWPTLLGIVAWALECVGFYLIIGGFAGARTSIGEATFIYAVTTIAGALAMLPGGLGVTEVGMVSLLRGLCSMAPAAATAATILTRIATLWFAVLVGIVALGIFRRRYGVAVDLSASSPEPNRERAGGGG